MANSFDLCRRAQSATEKVAFCTQAIAEFRRQDVLERAYLRRGNAFVELNDYARAADDFTALIQLNSHTAGYFDNRLHAYRSLGRLSEALNDANTEVRMRPDLAFVYRSRGLVYGDMNRLDLAVADFTRAISMEPANAGLLVDRGKLLSKSGRNRDAIADFSSALRIDGQAVEAYRERGLALMRVGELDNALADLSLFARLQPADQEVARAIQEIQSSQQRPLPPPPVDAGRPDTNQREVSVGTGFFVSSDGYVVTNAHVVEGCNMAEVISGLSAPLLTRILARDQSNDLAILKPDLKPTTSASLRIGAKIGEGIAAFGYPLAGLLATSGNFTLGNVSAVAGIGDDTRYIQVSAPIQPGNSGGPVLDQSGNVVGVVVSKLNALKVAKLTDDVSQNVNFAIKASVLTNFLDATGVSYSTSGPGSTMQSAELAERAKAISVMIKCRH